MSKKQDTGQCRCGACARTFKSLSVFDGHRVGAYADRRCLDDTQLVERGFSLDARGRWRGEPAKLAHWVKA